MIDLDGTIAELKKDGQTYADVRVNEGAVEKLRDLKAHGHYIIIQTARHMKTCDGNQGKVVAKIGKITLDWLEKNNIPYDEVYFGKPYTDIYIDDLAHKFTEWGAIKPEHLDTEKVNILIPMAGAGSRFVKAGYRDPKPLIDVLGEPMINWAMKSFNFLDKVQNHQLIFVILKEHDEKYNLSARLKKVFGQNIQVIPLDAVTRGQAETCLKAKEHINNHNKLFIYNCDNYSTSNIWEMIHEENPDGIIPCFEATDPRYSYAKNDSYGYVCETAEKRAISNLATTGMYYFRRGADFVSSAETMIIKNIMHNNEFYVAPCYNELLKSGKKIKTILVDTNHVMGTPEELDHFIKTYKK